MTDEATSLVYRKRVSTDPRAASKWIDSPRKTIAASTRHRLAPGRRRHRHGHFPRRGRTVLTQW